MAIVFKWNKTDLGQRLKTCEVDGIFPFVIKYFPKHTKILESGCGDARWVKFLNDRGWDATGIEISGETVAMVSKVWPELKIVQGDVSNSPFNQNHFDGVISLGVIEHWEEGPFIPLKDIHRILKPNGIGIITVPCLNTVRKFKKMLFWHEIKNLPKGLAKTYIRNEKFSVNRFQKKYKYTVYPSYGKFFEYRMSPNEFIQEVKGAGFEILEHFPIGQIDGVYHDLNPFKLLVKFNNWEFESSFIAKKINTFLNKKSFFHPHMQGVIVRKLKIS